MDSYSIDFARPSQDRIASGTQQPDLVCFSHLRWDFVTQRPQHILRRAAIDRRVFYWEEPIWHKDGDLPANANGSLGMHLDIVQVEPLLWTVRPHITWGIDFEVGQHALLEKFMQWAAIERFVLWYYTPMAHGFSSHLKPEATVYDCMDELTGFVGAATDLGTREQQLLACTDVVFTGGISLFEAKQKLHNNVHAFPSSIDVQHFAQAQKGRLVDPKDQAEIPHPRIGFYGVIDERLDIALLNGLAHLRPNYNFIILGPVVKIDRFTLPTAKNIFYLDGKSYEQLPTYLSGWDAAFLPFALNEATRFISPTKTPEYLAAGRAVVSTPIRDVVRGYGDDGLVAIAGTTEKFAEALDRALLPPCTDWLDAVKVKLSRTSWDATWNAMHHQIALATKSRKQSLRIEVEKTSHIKAPYVSSLWKDRATKAIRRPDIGYQDHFDYLVVGAGFSGAVLAERLASSGRRVLIIDQRDHIAGNAYDHLDTDGILVHKYGPHIFHTNSQKVVDYLSRFTQWRPYEHRVLSSVDSCLLPIPINLDTINRLYKLSLDGPGMKSFLEARIVPCTNIRTSEDVVLSRVGRELYEKFFRCYTRKQWGLDPSQLDAAVAGRIPVRFDHDDRYFTDSFQAMPLDGYTRMFERILDHPLITIRTGVSYQDVAKTYSDARIVYTGTIDEFFDFRFGPLPYRSLRFRHQTHCCEVFQSAPVVNYPNEHDFSRITEFKYLTGQRHAKTSIVYEYPTAVGEPYYPIPRPENASLYARYRNLALSQDNVHFCGRLANYRYFNMDQVVAQALVTFREISEGAHTSSVLPLINQQSSLNSTFATE